MCMTAITPEQIRGPERTVRIDEIILAVNGYLNTIDWRKEKIMYLPDFIFGDEAEFEVIYEVFRAAGWSMFHVVHTRKIYISIK